MAPSVILSSYFLPMIEVRGGGRLLTGSVVVDGERILLLLVVGGLLGSELGVNLCESMHGGCLLKI